MFCRDSCRLIRFLLLLFCLSCLSYILCIDHSKEIRPNDIISQLQSAPISLQDVWSALPRLDEENMVLRLRGGDREFNRHYRTTREDSLRKCFIIGATLTAAQWEWGYLQRFIHEPAIVDSLTSPIEQNLLTTNHELRNIGAPAELLKQIDQLKRNFEASDTTKLNLAKINAIFDQVMKELKRFLRQEHLGEQLFGLGEWLVYEAELSNLCLRMGEQYRNHFIIAMNQRYSLASRSDLELAYQRLFHAEPDSQRIPLLANYKKFHSQFPVSDLAGVKNVFATVLDIFRLMDIVFPKLG